MSSSRGRRSRTRLSRFAGGISVGLVVSVFACRFTDGLTGGPPLPGEDAGFDASDAPAPSCTADLTKSVENCGACGNACPHGPNSFPVCSDGGCLIACAPGFGDCDDASATGCEINLTNNRTNCGRCGHDCIGGACGGGQCQPFAMMTGTAIPVPAQIVGDDTYVYGIDAFGSVIRVRKDGGTGLAEPPLVTGDGTAQVPPPRIAMGDGALYYTTFGDAGADASEAGAVMKLPLDGGAPVVVTRAESPYAISSANGYVIWSQGNPAAAAPTSVERCDPSRCGATRETIAPPTTGRIVSVFASGTSVSWADEDSAVHRCAVAGPSCAQMTFSGPLGGQLPLAVTEDSGKVFWIGGSDILWCPADASCDLTLPRSLGQVLDVRQYGARGLALDATNVYWVSSDGSVRTIPKTSSLGAGERQYSKLPNQSALDILVDDSAIYWTETTLPALYRLAK